MIEVKVEGDQYKTTRSLQKIARRDYFSDFERYGQMGVRALSAATPVDTGLASHSWYYEVIRDERAPGIAWSNRDVEGGLNVIILIQYGHGTGTGGYVQGRDFINPAIQPVFDTILTYVWEKVTSA